jgi:hypothetical protein
VPLAISAVRLSWLKSMIGESRGGGEIQFTMKTEEGETLLIGGTALAGEGKGLYTGLHVYFG